MGYWLAPIENTNASGAELTIRFRAPGDSIAGKPEGSEIAEARPRTRPARTVRVKSPNSGEGDLHLTVAADGVVITGADSAWRTLEEPVLLAVCQYWRFTAVDRELDRLTELAARDIGHATLPSLASYKARKSLGEIAQSVRALLVDLPHFEGPLTDPYAYCSSERSADVYESLAKKLGLEEWCELLDERAEAVEDTYEAVTEKLFEYKNFLGEAFLEIIIVVILLAELAVMMWELLTP
jgi:hypothetical protein